MTTSEHELLIKIGKVVTLLAQHAVINDPLLDQSARFGVGAASVGEMRTKILEELRRQSINLQLVAGLIP